METLNKQQIEEILQITFRATTQFKGQLDKLEAALGALHLGHHIGWKGLFIVHNKRTIRQFEDILGIKFRDYFPETALGSDRLFGFRAAEELKKFWQVVSGDIKVAKKREIEN